jgi:magnesium chelatase family protein
MIPIPDYYEILQVSPQAEPEVIKAAYKGLALKYHPDRNREPEAVKIMRELNEAYEVLSDPERRADYETRRYFNEAETGHQKTPRAKRPSKEHDGKELEVATTNVGKFRSAVLRGITALVVEIQIALARPPLRRPAQANQGGGFVIVGLAKREVSEGAERLRNAFVSSGFAWPEGRITINLAPGDIPKEGTSLDLAIALSILSISRQITPSIQNGVYAIGALNFDGTLRRCLGALSVGRMIPDGSVLLAPVGNRYELGLLKQIHGPGRKDFTPYVVGNLAEAVAVVEGRSRPLPMIGSRDLKSAYGLGLDFREVKGQEQAKKGLEVAAAGGHSVLLIGPPGEGKTTLAMALPTILPKLTSTEIVDLTEIYSAKGLLKEDEVVLYRPFRPVHHTASPVAIVGGGSPFPMPGELTLAHHGVLFLDELPQFSGGTLDSLRQPLEDGSVNLARKGGAARYPCQIILVAAMNPCPCGFDGEFVCDACQRKISYGEEKCPECASTCKTSRCRCNTAQIRAYRNRISGPIMDRIDLTIRVGSLTVEEKFNSTQENEDSKSIRKRVEAARALQEKRFDGTGNHVNARIPVGKVDNFCAMTTSALAAMKEVAGRIPEITARQHDKLLKVARTIADLNGSASITKKHITHAAALCGHDRVKEFLNLQGEDCPSCGHPTQADSKYCWNCGTPI